MAYDTFPDDVIGPSFPIDKQAQPKTLKAEFGDDYTQETPDGINYLRYTYNLKWDALTTTERDIIEEFLVSQGGYKTFIWTDENAVDRKVKCREWSFSRYEPNVHSLSATFREVPV